MLPRTGLQSASLPSPTFRALARVWRKGTDLGTALLAPVLPRMKTRDLLPSVLIGAVASARSMTPMAAIAIARLIGRTTPGRLVLLDHPLIRFSAIVMGVGELAGDKMKSARDRTVALGLLARIMSAGIAGAALVPRGCERAGAAVAITTAVPLAYLTLRQRKRALAEFGQSRSGLAEDALVLAAAATVVALWMDRRG